MSARRASGRSPRTHSELITILWRDIPAQVIARSGRNKMAIELSGRFQTAIDRAAMAAGKDTYDGYIGEWRRTSRPSGEDVKAEAEAAAARLESDYPNERIFRLAANGGYEDPPSPGRVDEYRRSEVPR